MRRDAERHPSLLGLLWQGEVEAYLREIGPTMPAVARALAAFGPDVLELWMAQPGKA